MVEVGTILGAKVKRPDMKEIKKVLKVDIYDQGGLCG